MSTPRGRNHRRRDDSAEVDSKSMTAAEAGDCKERQRTEEVVETRSQIEATDTDSGCRYCSATASQRAARRDSWILTAFLP